MRVSRFRAAAVVVCLCLSPAFAQVPVNPQFPASSQSGQSDQNTQDPNQGTGPTVVQPPLLPGERPLTPEELRKKQIDALDPLAKTPDEHPDQPRETKPKTAADTPLPGSVAESNQTPTLRTEGPQVVSGPDDTTDQQYNGPAVLSRSYTLTRPTVPKQIRWSWKVGAGQVFASGLVNVFSAATTPAATSDSKSYGSTANFSFQGRHLWKRDQIGVTYNASYNRYTNVSGYNGTNQILNLDYGHEFSRHLQLNIVESGSILTQSGTLSNPAADPGVSVANISLAASPTVQPYDLTTRQSTTQISLTWQKSARLSFSYSGGIFGVQRTGIDLTGDSGYQAQSDINYRLTRKTTVGVYYSYVTYVFSHHFADSDSNTLGLIYSYALGRSAQIRSRFGISRIENVGLTQVAIDPVIAILLGRASGVIESYHLTETSDISGEFVKDFGKRRTANLSYAHGVSPGNGSILTSTQQSIGASFSSVIFRRYNLSVGIGQTALSATLQTISKYTSDYVNFTLSHNVTHNLQANVGFSYRKYEIVGAPAVMPQWTITSGVTWGPPEGKLW